MNQKAVSFLSILGAFLVVGLLVLAMKHYTAPAPLNQSRAAERRAALKQVRDDAVKTLANTEAVDPAKGGVRLKIDAAMDLTVKEYQNPAAFRTNLTARANKAAEPPPKAPEEPSKFE